MFSIGDLIEAKATEIREETSYPGKGLFWGTEIPEIWRQPWTLWILYDVFWQTVFTSQTPVDASVPTEHSQLTLSGWGLAGFPDKMTHESSVEGCTRAKQDGDSFSSNGGQNGQSIRDMNKYV